MSKRHLVDKKQGKTRFIFIDIFPLDPYGLGQFSGSDLCPLRRGALVRESLDLLREKLESQKLLESADLYAETYREDSELKALTDSAAKGWPE